jgi:signal transduction histidine kinase
VLRPLNLSQWLPTLLDDYEALAADHDLAIEFVPEPSLPPVNADGGFLAQVLVNLLNNAINYTPPGGKITVKTRRRRAGSKSWAGFSVIDSGPGISPEEQERLFERFFRGSAGRAGRAPGTGLGLSIVQEIVSLHHGRIEVESSGVPGEGAAFHVWLPAARPGRSRRSSHSKGGDHSARAGA